MVDKASEHGVYQTLRSLGQTYRSSGTELAKWGIARTVEKAREVFTKAIRAGGVRALAHTADLLIEDEDDVTNGVRYISLAAAYGWKTSQSLLGYAYLVQSDTKLGLQRNLEKSL